MTWDVNVASVEALSVRPSLVITMDPTTWELESILINVSCTSSEILNASVFIPLTLESRSKEDATFIFYIYANNFLNINKVTTTYIAKWNIFVNLISFRAQHY